MKTGGPIGSTKRTGSASTMSPINSPEQKAFVSNTTSSSKKVATPNMKMGGSCGTPKRLGRGK